MIRSEWKPIAWSLVACAVVIAGSPSVITILEPQSCGVADPGSGSRLCGPEGRVLVSTVLTVAKTSLIALGIFWWIKEKQARLCPVCTARVATGITTCQRCGHDFAAAARHPASWT